MRTDPVQQHTEASFLPCASLFVVVGSTASSGLAINPNGNDYLRYLARLDLV